MRILRNYILLESIVPFFMSLAVLTCVFLLGNLIKLTDLVINKGVPLRTVGEVFILYIPVLLGYTLPIACLLAVILTFSRFSVDNEIIAIRASSIHLGRVLLPVAIMGFLMSISCIYLNDRVVPYAHHKQREILKTLGSQNPTALLEAGVFIHSFNNQILFIHKIDGNRMYNVTIYQPQEDGPTRTIIAKRGEFTPVPDTNQVKLKLMDGTSDEPNLENPNNFYKLNFKNYFMTLDLTSANKKIEKKPKSMTLNELKVAIEEEEKLFNTSSRYRTEYWRKISWSFSPLVFVLLGFPLAVITNRRAKSANVTIAIACAAVYYLLSIGCESLAIQEIAPPHLILWVPNFIGLTVASILNFKCVS